MSIEVRPARLRQLGDPRGVTFCVITTRGLLGELAIEAPGYDAVQTFVVDRTEDFERLLLTEVPERAHVLVVSPEVFFRSPSPEVLGPGRKLLGMACNSTPANRDTIAHFLQAMEQTDPERMDGFADSFIERGRSCRYLQLVDTKWNVRATFEHLHESYEWNQQAGSLDWGEQQIAPAGEISVLPMSILEFDESRSLAIDGHIALCGPPILHSGTPSFARADQLRLYESLATMQHTAVIARVEAGVITRLEAAGPAAAPACRSLEALFAVDSRYRTLWEVGFAVNTALRLLPGNNAMNEVYGGKQGVVHWGLGLTPYTQYHLDIISPGTRVLDDAGNTLFGADGQDDAQRARRGGGDELAAVAEGRA